MYAYLLTLAIGTLAVLQASDEIHIEPGKQLPQQVTLSSKDSEPSATVRYMLFTPEDYSQDGKPWPLLLFLHGYGESSDSDLNRVKIHGPAKLVDSRPDFPFVVVTPQISPPKREMAEIVKGWKPDQLIHLVDHVIEHLNIDRSRVYVTGLSMGGYGTWRVAATYPDRFAAAAPICGGGDPETMAKALSRVPIWAFHGQLDLTVPVSKSQEMVDAVRGAGGDVRLTVYPDVGHNSWVPAYDGQELYDWLLAQSLDSR